MAPHTSQIFANAGLKRICKQECLVLSKPQNPYDIYLQHLLVVYLAPQFCKLGGCFICIGGGRTVMFKNIRTVNFFYPRMDKAEKALL